MDSKDAIIANLVSAVVDKTFVYDNVEIRKTGREAHRKTTSGKPDVLLEVTPASENSGAWKKWVRETELYEVR